VCLQMSTTSRNDLSLCILCSKAHATAHGKGLENEWLDSLGRTKREKKYSFWKNALILPKPDTYISPGQPLGLFDLLDGPGAAKMAAK
jgi:hypothetical protein